MRPPCGAFRPQRIRRSSTKRNEDKTPQPRGDTERERREREGESGRVGDKGTRGQGYFSPCLSVSRSPALPLSRSSALRPTHSLTLCLRAAAALSRSKAIS